MADVDYFKRYNDAHGHPAGDAVLKRVAEVLRESTRDVDFVARYGGENSSCCCRKSRRAAPRNWPRGAQAPGVGAVAGGGGTLSFGIAEYPAHGDTGEALIAIADAALYQAKDEGRDQVLGQRPLNVGLRLPPDEALVDPAATAVSSVIRTH